MQRFPSQHVSLVTGASTGIGAATAILLAERGSTVAVHFNKNEAAAKDVVSRISQAGGKATTFQADLTQPEAPTELVKQVLAEHGRIDLLVNNAGSLFERRSLFEITDDYWARIFALNVDSVIRLVRLVAPGMVERRSGAIINISSIAGRNGGGPGALAYATAKGAVLTMTKGLAKELIAHGIRVNAVNPGVIATPFHEQFTSEQQMKAMIANIPQKRAGTSEETATVVAFLASDDASHIVGEAIEVNGGLLMD